MTPLSRLVACANCGHATRESLVKYACPWCNAWPFPVEDLEAPAAVNPVSDGQERAENGSCGTHMEAVG